MGNTAIQSQEFCSGFLQGQNDCKEGVGHKPGMTEAYDRGYAAQYEFEQTVTAQTLQRADR